MPDTAKTAKDAQMAVPGSPLTASESPAAAAEASGSANAAPTPRDAATQALISAKTSAVQILTDAKNGAEKLIAIAAGDEKTLLTEAETAAIPVLLHAVPAPFAGVVAPFAQAAATKLEGAINAAVDPLVNTGLGFAHNWLESTIAVATSFIDRLGTRR